MRARVRGRPGRKVGIVSEYSSDAAHTVAVAGGHGCNGPEAGASLVRKGIGADLLVAQGECRPSSGPIQERAGIPTPIGAKAGYFQRETVIADARDGPTDDGDTDDLTSLNGSQRELVPNHRRVVPVVPLDEGIGISQPDGEEGEPEGHRSRA